MDTAKLSALLNRPIDLRDTGIELPRMLCPFGIGHGPPRWRRRCRCGMKFQDLLHKVLERTLDLLHKVLERTFGQGNEASSHSNLLATTEGAMMRHEPSMPQFSYTQLGLTFSGCYNRYQHFL